MKTLEYSIEVQKPVHAVYNQWTRFEDFPYFMKWIKDVRQIDDRHVHWQATFGGVTKAWDTEIFEQVPDQRIGWRSTCGPLNTGRVRFSPISQDSSRVTIVLNYVPRGLLEHLGNWLGLVARRLEDDLKAFKEFIESRGMPPRGWRGESHSQNLQWPADILQLHTQPAFAMLETCRALR